MQTQIKRLKSRKGETYVDTGIKILSAVVCGALVLGSIFWILKSTVLSNVNNAVADLFNTPEKNPLEGVMWEPGVEKVPSTSEFWTMDETTLTGYIGPKTSGMHLVIPNEVDGVRVLRIQRAADGAPAAQRYNIFGNTSETTSMTIEISNGIKEIGLAAFNGCSGFTGDLIIPDSVITIGDGAFYKCTGLNGQLILSSNLETIGTSAFQQCGFTGDLIIPDSVTAIRDGTFNKCIGLNGQLVLSANLKTLGSGTFQQCAFTGPLVLPDSLESMGTHTFNQCAGFDSLTLSNNLKSIGSTAFQYCTGFSNELILPDSLESIGNYAFNHCSDFTNTTLVLPPNLKSFGTTHMFYNFATSTCASVTIAASNPYFKTVDGVLYTKDGARLLYYPPKKSDVTYTLPEGVTDMNELCFSYNSILETLTLPNSYLVRTSGFPSAYLNASWGNGLAIGIYIFTSIENITVKADNPRYASVNGALYSKDLKSLWYMPVCRTGAIVIPDGTERLEYGCLYPKYATSVYIPESVTFIDNTVITSLNYLSATVTISPDNPGYRVENGIIIEK